MELAGKVTKLKIIDAGWYVLKSELILLEAQEILEELEKRLREQQRPSEVCDWMTL